MSPTHTSTPPPPNPPSFLRKLQLLLWKIGLQKWRNPLTTLSSLIVPILVGVALMELFPKFGVVHTDAKGYVKDVVSLLPIGAIPYQYGGSELKFGIGTVRGDAESKKVRDGLKSMLIDLYPGWKGKDVGFVSSEAKSLKMPSFSSVLKVFESNEDLEGYVSSARYGLEGNPSLGAALMVDVLEAGDVQVQVRLNASRVPATGSRVLLSGPSFSSISSYASFNAVFTRPVKSKSAYFQPSPGFLPIQLDAQKLLSLHLSSPSTTPTPPPLPESALDEAIRDASHFLLALGVSKPSVDVEKQEWRNVNHTSSSLSTLSTLFYLSFPTTLLLPPSSLTFTAFPTPPTTTNDFFTLASPLLPIFLLSPLLFPSVQLARSMTAEKEGRMREGLFFAGVSPLTVALSWSIAGVVEWVVISLALSLSLTATGPFTLTSPALLFFLLLLFGLSSISLAHLVTSLSTRARTAAASSFFLFIFLFLPHFIVREPSSSAPSRLTAAFFCPPTALGLAIDTLTSLEQAHIPPTLLSTSSSPFPLSTALILLPCSALFFLLLALYLDATLPPPFREFGTPRHPLFPCHAIASCISSMRHTPTTPTPATPLLHTPSILPGDAPQHLVQPPDARLKALAAANQCISIRGLHKTFNQKVAVKPFTLTLYKGQALALLGHNGAGKTTLISMLTGLLAPSGGSARVLGHEVPGDVGGLRGLVGVCPQQNCVYEELTAREHLELMAALRGCPGVRESAEETLETMLLSEKGDARAGKLSGGQKRKLCVGMALVGDVPVAVLDEPCAGMDTYARRSVILALQKAKHSRVLLFTTHALETAEFLGDRIAIMAAGALRCVGSPIFLKEQYKVGYELTVVTAKDKKRESEGGGEGGGGSAGGGVGGGAGDLGRVVKDIVLEQVPGAKEVAHGGREVRFRLPLSSSPNLPRALEALPPVDSLGLSVTTAEDIFLKIASEEDAAIREERGEGVGDVVVGVDESDKDQRWDGGGLWFFLMVGWVFEKRWYVFRRDSASWFWGLLSVIVVVVGVSAIHAALRLAQPSLPLTPSILPSLTTPSFSFYSTNIPHTAVAKEAVATLKASSLNPSFIHRSQAPTKGHFVLHRNKRSSDPNAYVTSQMTQILYDRVVDGDEERYAALTFPTSLFPINTSTLQPPNGTLEVNILTNLTTPHAPPVIASAIFNALSPHNITPINFPFPPTAKESVEWTNVVSVMLALIVHLGVSFFPMTFPAHVVAERVSGALHLQTLAGLHPAAYWIAQTFWDFLLFQFPAWSAVATLAAFDLPAFVETENSHMAATILLLLTFGFASAPVAYLITRPFSSPSNSQALVLVSNLVGLALTVAAVVIGRLDPPTCKSFEPMRAGTRFLPSFALGDGLLALVFADQLPSLEASCQGLEVPTNAMLKKFENGLNWDVAGADIAMMAIIGTLALITILIQDALLSNPAIMAMFEPRVPSSPSHPTPTQSSPSPTPALRLDRLHKVYGDGTHAVRGLSFEVEKGEFFGFLGVNGSGKSSTMNVLMGVRAASAGSAFVDGFDVQKESHLVKHRVGYCPQHNALIDHLTVREHLVYFGRLRQLARKVAVASAKALERHLGIEEFAHFPVSTLSGGTKRKLNVAIALTGTPSLIALDEPSAGLDIVAKRRLWDALTSFHRQHPQTAFLFTSHSLEEVEALCDRIGILVSGQMDRVGTVQSVKSDWGGGLQAEVRVLSPEEQMSEAEQEAEEARRVTQVIEWVEHAFERATLAEQTGTRLRFHIPGEGVSNLIRVFSAIETEKTNLHIGEYAVGQTSLDAIFYAIAKAAGEGGGEEG